MTAPKPKKLVLDRRSARRLYDVAMSGMSADDVTPVICAAHVTAEGTTLTVTVTDRYRVHTAPISIRERVAGFDALIPRAAFQWLAKNLNAFGRDGLAAQQVVITLHSEGQLVIEVQESSALAAAAVAWRGSVTKGNFPPVDRLIEKARAAEETTGPVRLNLNFLGKAGALGNGYEAPLFKFTATDKTDKPGPLYLRWGNADAPTAEALVQPHVLIQ